jgi:hypothetical protein
MGLAIATAVIHFHKEVLLRAVAVKIHLVERRP